MFLNISFSCVASFRSFHHLIRWQLLAGHNAPEILAIRMPAEGGLDIKGYRLLITEVIAA